MSLLSFYGFIRLHRLSFAFSGDYGGGMIRLFPILWLVFSGCVQSDKQSFYEAGLGLTTTSFRTK
jgi:hypothetical protein